MTVDRAAGHTAGEGRTIAPDRATGQPGSGQNQHNCSQADNEHALEAHQAKATRPTRPLDQCCDRRAISLSKVTDGTTARRRVRPLTKHEIASYNLIPAELAARVRVVLAPVPGPYRGMALGRFVFIDRDIATDGSSTLLAHELVHVRQWSELGVVGFTIRYLSQFVTGLAKTRSWNAAYRQIEVEREARASAEEWRLRRNTQGPTG